MTRVLVTGATGFVGGRVAARLRARGDEVVAPVRTPSAELAALGVHQEPVGLDLTPELLEGVRAIVHAAASVGPSLEAGRSVNRDGTRRVAQLALDAGVPRLVHLSTTSVYDRDALQDGVVDEDTPLSREGAAPGPASSSGSAYAVTKAEAEAEIAAAADRGLSTAVLRPPAVLGAGRTSTWGTRVPRRLLDGEGGARHPETTFAFVHVEDLVDAVLAALDTDVALVANVIGGHTTVGRYHDAVTALLPGEVSVPAPAPDDVPWAGTFASDRLTAVLGITPSRSFDDAMCEIAASWADGAPDAG